ncbi:branched-chain amino acid transport system II carrier protein [Bifidobacterium sp. ESL0763]|uniref:branched-chain amino acid transport system II carrier protein n=1 Tax=Bifidobacterium sp. ESL0763 TaxID=2983227 RepID=UPI0023F8D565|nr:branched-chain amino acid transport system II carrier protein [Bifidobacterium sp. ESL0763]MDF7664004.1 branched-chain amino acid transport system II carrier protein [Bifidobacterium sp. ESL0763]
MANGATSTHKAESQGEGGAPSAETTKDPAATEHPAAATTTATAKPAGLPYGKRLVVAFTFFSMFFGAGNLIFPPLMGAQSQSASVPATIGFIVSAVGLPILGVLAVASAGGFERLASRVSPRFAAILAFVIIMAIGPCFAIPRTATTSYEMAITPFFGENNRLALLVYSLVFFALSFILSQHPERLSKSLGRVMGPLLLALIVVMFVSCVFIGHGALRQPFGEYAHGALVYGFVNGYQTMDLLAALYFGIVISANISQFGVTETRANRREISIAGASTGVLLILIYSALSFIGAVSGSIRPANGKNDTGATVLTNITTSAFGSVGTLFVGLIFVLACFNVCTGLISTCATYFEEHFPTVLGHPVRYRAWTVVFAIFSFVVSNAGLSAIITVSLPVLGALYPIAIVLVALNLVERPFSSRFPRVYFWTVLLVAIFSIVDCVVKLLAVFGLPVAAASDALATLPLYGAQLTWLIPAALGIVIGVVDSLIRSRRHGGDPSKAEGVAVSE